MKDRLKDYFSYNRKEQRGLIILLGLMICLLVSRYALTFKDQDQVFDLEPFRKQVEAFRLQVLSGDSLATESKAPFRVDKTAEKHDLSRFRQQPFPFDPNQLSESEWRSIGIHDRTISSILKYRQKGGQFRSKEDLAKIYTLPDSVYRILEPWIAIETRLEKAKHQQKAPEPYSGKLINPPPVKSLKMVELNSADSIALLDLNGIGPSFAGRITRYKNLLGGFANPTQILEVRGMDSVRYNQFIGQCLLDTALIRKMDLNTVTFREMLRHPYFEYYLVKAIFRHKDEIGKFDSLEQIKDLEVMYEELYEKIRPYLQVTKTGQSGNSQEGS